MISVGLTGSVASGKSEVSRAWQRAGVPVVSADELARIAVEPGSAGLDAVVDALGSDILKEDGSLDRARVRSIVFRDDDARRCLENIIHPIVRRHRETWVQAQQAEGADLIVSEIPLLFESGRAEDFDCVVVVDAPYDTRLSRMIEFRGLSEDEARRVMTAQMDANEKRQLADILIRNEGTLEQHDEKAGSVLEELRSRFVDRRMKIDMHIHTLGSWDSLSDPERVLEVAMERGFQRVAITDHNRVHVGLRMAECYPDVVIPGEEVKTAEGIDVIVPM